jgi:hypothetical protein
MKKEHQGCCVSPNNRIPGRRRGTPADGGAEAEGDGPHRMADRQLW